MTKVYKILVCGGRDYLSYSTVKDSLQYELDANKLDYKDVVIIQGGAKGADFLAKVWAFEYGVSSIEYTPDWKKYGIKAGIIRNQEMLDESKPDLVVAFPGGNGTAHMISIAQKTGVEVRVIS